MKKDSTNYKISLYNYLVEHISENKKTLFGEIIKNRTKHITVVLEDIYQPHNASAVLRTSDCFGIQDVHIIENKNTYEVNPYVALGSSKWVNLIKYSQKDNNTVECIKTLKENGYRIVATTPHKDDVDMEDFDIERKCALFFGTEMHGLSGDMLDHADEYLKIPMFGFTESFNISVSAAIIISNLISRLHKSDIEWRLTEEEKAETLLNWSRNVIKKDELLEKEFCRKIGLKE